MLSKLLKACGNLSIPREPDEVNLRNRGRTVQEISRLAAVVRFAALPAEDRLGTSELAAE